VDGLQRTWDSRRDRLFALMDFVFDAFIEEDFDGDELRRLSRPTIDAIVALGEVWDADIDVKGYRQKWEREIRDWIGPEKQRGEERSGGTREETT
jgi:hypothetical protein